MSLDIYRPPYSSMSEFESKLGSGSLRPDLSYSFTSSLADSKSNVDLQYSVLDKALLAVAVGEGTDLGASATGRIASVRDLRGSIIVANFSEVDQGEWSTRFASLVHRLEDGVRISRFEISTSGRVFDLSQQIRRIGRPSYDPFRGSTYELQLPLHLDEPNGVPF